MDYYGLDDEESPLPDGTYPISLSQATQERFECVAEWDLSILEPQKIVQLEKIKEDLKKQDSDFAPLKDHIKQCKQDEVLIIIDPTKTYGANFLLCLNGESKYHYLQSEEDGNMQLVENYERDDYEYIPPVPGEWRGMASDIEIERDWVTDSRPKIRLQIKRVVPRKDVKLNFKDRNVKDVNDGYVACLSQKLKKQLKHVEELENSMQAVPVLVDNSSQTELRHPKNIYTQYEPRIFTDEEVEKLEKSDEMKKFLRNAVDIVNEVQDEPDIMGDLRDVVECFYKRDHVEVVEETELKEMMFFTDLNFSHQMKVSHIRWHPTIPGVVAMSVQANTFYEHYLKLLTHRLVLPNMLMIWSMAHPLFPQILLRITDDVTKFEWHPNEDGILIGGCVNGQVLIWDLSEYVPKLKAQISIWDHQVIMEKQTDKLHIHDGFIPVLHWCAESNLKASHKARIEDLHWLPANVAFSHESAYPKQNPDPNMRQFITCSAEAYILVWDLKRPPAEILPRQATIAVESSSDDDVFEEDEEKESEKPKFSGWAGLRKQTGALVSTYAFSKDKKWSPAIGKYKYLNKVWKPVHKICFLETSEAIIAKGPNYAQTQAQKEEEPTLKILITSLSVTDRPDLIMKKNKKSTKGMSLKLLADAEMMDDKSGAKAFGAAGKTVLDYQEGEQTEKHGHGSVSTADDDDDDEMRVDPTQIALPTLMMAGTVWGDIIRADLSKNKVDVETNNLLCSIEWMTAVHDGPVQEISKCPFMPHLLMSVGGYSFAIWNEGVMNKPVILHFVSGEQFSAAAWSLTQPHVVFFSTERGNIQVWDITKRRSEPFQSQNVAGSPINAICPYNHLGKRSASKKECHYLSVADDTGVLRLMLLPKHLHASTEQAVDNLQEFIDKEIAKKEAKERTKLDRAIENVDNPTQEQGQTSLPSKRTWEQEIKEDTKIPDTAEEILRYYFGREKIIMEKLFGMDWKKHAKHPDWPRERYTAVIEKKKKMKEKRDSSDSSEEDEARKALEKKTKAERLAHATAKAKGVVTLLKMKER